MQTNKLLSGGSWDGLMATHPIFATSDYDLNTASFTFNEIFGTSGDDRGFILDSSITNVSNLTLPSLTSDVKITLDGTSTRTFAAKGKGNQ